MHSIRNIARHASVLDEAFEDDHWHELLLPRIEFELDVQTSLNSLPCRLLTGCQLDSKLEDALCRSITKRS